MSCSPTRHRGVPGTPASGVAVAMVGGLTIGGFLLMSGVVAQEMAMLSVDPGGAMYVKAGGVLMLGNISSSFNDLSPPAPPALPNESPHTGAVFKETEGLSIFRMGPLPMATGDMLQPAIDACAAGFPGGRPLGGFTGYSDCNGMVFNLTGSAIARPNVAEDAEFVRAGDSFVLNYDSSCAYEGLHYVQCREAGSDRLKPGERGQAMRNVCTYSNITNNSYIICAFPIVSPPPPPPSPPVMPPPSGVIAVINSLAIYRVGPQDFANDVSLGQAACAAAFSGGKVLGGFSLTGYPDQHCSNTIAQVAIGSGSRASVAQDATFIQAGDLLQLNFGSTCSYASKYWVRCTAAGTGPESAYRNTCAYSSNGAGSSVICAYEIPSPPPLPPIPPVSPPPPIRIIAEREGMAIYRVGPHNFANDVSIAIAACAQVFPDGKPLGGFNKVDYPQGNCVTAGSPSGTVAQLDIGSGSRAAVAQDAAFVEPGDILQLNFGSTCSYASKYWVRCTASDIVQTDRVNRNTCAYTNDASDSSILCAYPIPSPPPPPPQPPVSPPPPLPIIAIVDNLHIYRIGPRDFANDVQLGIDACAEAFSDGRPLGGFNSAQYPSQECDGPSLNRPVYQINSIGSGSRPSVAQDATFIQAGDLLQLNYGSTCSYMSKYWVRCTAAGTGPESAHRNTCGYSSNGAGSTIICARPAPAA